MQKSRPLWVCDPVLESCWRLNFILYDWTPPYHSSIDKGQWIFIVQLGWNDRNWRNCQRKNHTIEFVSTFSVVNHLPISCCLFLKKSRNVLRTWLLVQNEEWRRWQCDRWVKKFFRDIRFICRFTDNTEKLWNESFSFFSVFFMRFVYVYILNVTTTAPSLVHNMWRP